MLSDAQTGTSRVISYHLRDIGGYQSTVGYICYHGKEPWGNVNRGRAESMCRLTHVWGARHEPKGRLGLNVLAFGVPDCAMRYEPAKYGPELYQR